MNKILEWFTKKKIFLFSLLGIVSFFIAYFSIYFGICFNYPNQCNNNSELVAVYTMLFIPIFFFSLITFKLKQSTFNTWRNFSFYSILVFLILISFIPMRTHGLDYLPITKGLVSFLLTILYSVISLILVIAGSLKKN